MSYSYRYDRGGAAAAAAQYGSAQLPIGWQLAYSTEGELYYIDHNTRTTHWQIPPEVMQSMNHSTGFRVGRARRGIDRSKAKTKMCMNIQNGGKCTWGDFCAFAHSSSELAAVPHGGGGGGGGMRGGSQRSGGAPRTGDSNPYYNGVNNMDAKRQSPPQQSMMQ